MRRAEINGWFSEGFDPAALREAGDPDVDRGDSQKRPKACHNALPSDDQTAGLLLAPGNQALGLAPWQGMIKASVWYKTLIFYQDNHVC